MIGCCGLIFSACTPTYNNVKISALTKTIEMAVGDTKKLEFEFENAPESMSKALSLNYANDLFQKLSERAEDNKVVYEIKALRAGQTTVEVVSFEGEKTCTVNVKVFDKITAFSAKQDLFVVASQEPKTIILAQQDYFSFLPQNAKAPKMKFEYKPNELAESVEVTAFEVQDNTIKLKTDGGYVADNADNPLVFAQGEITLTATPLDYATNNPMLNVAGQEIVVNIVPKIELGDLLLYGHGAGQTTFLNDKTVVDEDFVLGIVNNHKQYSYFVFEVECETANVQMSFESDLCECTEILISDNVQLGMSDRSTTPNNKYFGVQSIALGSGTIKVKLEYQSGKNFGQNSYYEEFVIPVRVKNAPWQVNMNGVANLALTLFTQSPTTQSVHVNVLDKTATFKEARVFLATDEVDGKWVANNTLFDKIQVLYGQTERTEEFAIPFSDFSANKSVWPITLRAKQVPQEIVLVVEIVPEDKDAEIYGNLNLFAATTINIQEGIASFDVHEDYKETLPNGTRVPRTLYLDIDDGAKEFDGFIIGNLETANLSEFKFQVVKGQDNVVELQQQYEDLKLTSKLTITPKNVGKTTVRVTAQDGYYVDLPFEVVTTLQNASLAVLPSVLVTNPTTEHGSITGFAMALEADKLNQVDFAVIKEQTLATHYRIDPKIPTAGDGEYIQILHHQNDQITIKALEVTNNTKVTISVDLFNSAVGEKFTIAENSETPVKTFNVEIEIYSPIQSIEFVERVENTAIKPISGFSINRLADVGQNYASRAQYTCELRVTRKDGVKFDNSSTNIPVNWNHIQMFNSLGTITTTDNKEFTISDFGTYTLTNWQFTFNCNNPNAFVGAFNFTATINDHGISYPVTLKIDVQSFKALNYVGISHYQSTIYLTGVHPTQTLFTYMDPTADIREFQTEFEPTKPEYANILKVAISKDYSQVTLSLANGQAANGSGYLYFVPSTMYTEHGVDHSKVQKVFVICSNGESEAFPELIASADEFINAITPAAPTITKHYCISSTINLSGRQADLKRAKPLAGSIVGTNPSAKLTNININLTNFDLGDLKTSFGLFPRILEGGKFANIAIDGTITVNIDNIGTNKNFALGLLAGENFGSVQNVSAVIGLSSNITIQDLGGSNHVSIGGLVGKNYGEILTAASAATNDKNYDFGDVSKINLTTVQISQLNVNYIRRGAADSTSAYLGGLVGENLGLIERKNISTKMFNINNYTENINIFAAGLSGTGAVVGLNASAGQIINHSTIGHISKHKDQTTELKCVGGIAGVNEGTINNCTVRANISASDIVGGICGEENNSSGVTGNKVQAVKKFVYQPMLVASTPNSANIGAFCGSGDIPSNNQAECFYEMTAQQKPIKHGLDTFDGAGFDYKAASVTVTTVQPSDGVQTMTVTGENLPGDINNRIINMFIYTALDANNQQYIQDKNTRDLPFEFENSDAITISTRSPSIAEVDSTGRITLLNTGIAKLQVSSVLDETISATIYVNVVHAYNALRLESSNGHELQPSSLVNVYSHIPAVIKVRFIADALEATDKYGQPIQVELVDSLAPQIVVEYTEAQSYTTASTNTGSMVIFSSNNNQSGANRNNTVTFTPKFELALDEIGFNGAVAKVESFGEERLSGKQVTVRSILGTQTLALSAVQTQIQPSDEILLTITQITDEEGDDVTFTCVKLDNNNTQDNFFVQVEKKTTSTDDASSNTSTKVHQIKLKFNIAQFADYVGTYHIIFRANNNQSQTLIVNVEEQQLNNITFKNYYNVKTTEYNPSAPQSYQVSSGDINLLEIGIYPSFANFDYVIVQNAQTGAQNQNVLLFEFVRLNNEGQFELLDGIIHQNNKVFVPKQLLETNVMGQEGLARLFVHYTTTDRSNTETIGQIDVAVAKGTVQNPSIILMRSMPINIVVKDSVYFTLDNRTNVEKHYVARGLTYNLTLNIFGFTQSEMKYEITHEGQPTNAVGLQNNAGKFQLVVSKEIPYHITANNPAGYEVQISTYGEKIVDGLRFRSAAKALNVVVVEFVLLQDNIGSYDHQTSADAFEKNLTIAGAQGAVVSVPVGSGYALSHKLLLGKTVEFDPANEEVIAKVALLEKMFTQNGTWEIHAKNPDDGVLENFAESVIINSNTKQKTKYLNINGLTITPLRVNSIDQSRYYFSYTSNNYCYELGSIKFLNDAGGVQLSTHFVLEAYPTSSEVNAIPVSNYAEFVDMLDNAHYVLLADITLPQDFVPITAQVASFDGNGHKFILPSSLHFDEGEQFGLFATVADGAILKNITVEVANSATITVAPENTTASFGVIAGVNNGVVTNCAVTSRAFATLTVALPNQTSELIDNIVAGLVGINNGFVSNSRVSLNLLSQANVAGLVGNNNGKIASCFVRESAIMNQSPYSAHKTAGLVLKNGTAQGSLAEIGACYVLGATTDGKFFSVSQDKAIMSRQEAAGLVFTNFGKIQDCYADTYIKTSSTAAGFVYQNSGHVERCYTTSTFHEEGQDAYVFVHSNRVENGNLGTYKNCYYFVGSKNTTAHIEDLTGLNRLDDKGFTQISSYQNFAISDNTSKEDAVWFMPAKNEETDFKNGTANMKFSFGKLELVAPNTIAYTQRVLDADNTTVLPETGETVYVYTETRAAVGTRYNPIVIASAKAFEANIQNTTRQGVCSAHFRLVKDINYRTEGVYLCQTYNTVFVGTFEGNFMQIAGFALDNRAEVKSAGLFAQIGQGATGRGVVKNLILAPYYINTPNATCAGTLAGSLESGKVFNVVADGYAAQMDGVKIVGKNAVGGVIGMATGNFKMINIKSSISVNASYNHTKQSMNFSVFEGNETINKVSYAGGVVGIAQGGLMNNISIFDAVIVSGEICGLVAGLVGNAVTLAQVNQVVLPEQKMIASVYGGIIAGSLSGTIQNCVVTGDFAANAASKPNTTNEPMVAFGGLVGFMPNGQIANSRIAVSLIWEVMSPKIVGGLVGEMLGGHISNSTFTGSQISVVASNNQLNIIEIVVGGLVGKVSPTPSTPNAIELLPSKTSIDNCSATYSKITVSLVNVLQCSVGGALGQCVMSYFEEDTIPVALTTLPRGYVEFNGVFSSGEIEINNIIYGGELKTYVGGLVGSVFADDSKMYEGEVVMLGKATQVGHIASASSSGVEKIQITVTDNRSMALVNTYFGGILGYGKTVEAPSTLHGEFNSRLNPWGYMLELEDAVNRKFTSPEYLGKWSEENTYQNFADSGVFGIEIKAAIPGNVIQNEHGENQLQNDDDNVAPEQN